MANTDQVNGVPNPDRADDPGDMTTDRPIAEAVPVVAADLTIDREEVASDAGGSGDLTIDHGAIAESESRSGGSMASGVGSQPGLHESGALLGSVPGYSKQERDAAFAVALLGGGRISERELGRAVTSWTVHGAIALSEHLRHLDVIEEDEGRRLSRTAARRLDGMREPLDSEALRASESDLPRLRFRRIDPSGRVLRLLGLGTGDDMVVEPEDRQVAGRYSLIRRIGSGGLGTVWLARDESLKRYVAVKEIKERARDDEAAQARFRREAEISGRLEHPAIVPVYQFGRDLETGRLFYVMRFLGRHTLRDGIAEYHERRDVGHDDPMLLHRLLTAFVSLCYAVAHAHARGVIHRDLKPENVALDGFGKVVLLDWGLAKINSETGVYDVGGSVEPADVQGSEFRGRVVGTPMYMAPEQASGRLEEIDERTDIYGLGGVLFTILTGSAPHESSHVSISSQSPLSEILAAIVENPTPSPRSLSSKIAPELDAICTKALAKRRFLRYQSAVDLADEVDRFLAGERVDAYREPVRVRLRRWLADRPRLSQALALLLLALTASGATLAVSARQARIAARHARFEQIEDVAEELHFAIRAEVESLSRDVRFASELPPIQEIIRRRDPSGAAGAGAISGVEAESEDIWQKRLGSVFSGILKGHPEYHVIAFDEGGDRVRELIRFEQGGPGGRIYRIAEGQLAEFSPSDVVAELEGLRAGDVLIRTGAEVDAEAPTRDRGTLTLVALTPVFDARTGDLFGFAVIEADLQRTIRERIAAMGPDGIDVAITDDDGRVALAAGRIARAGGWAEGVTGRAIETATRVLFRPGATRRSVGIGDRLHAVRVDLGDGRDGRQGALGVIALEPPED